MCGIYGFSGQSDEAPKKVMEGLRQLVYRGYDSWGIAAKNCRGLVFRKEVGKIIDAANDAETIKSNLAIGHTRWATHGKVSPENAHPHFNKKKTLAVVHNGIIENHSSLRRLIEEKAGEVFVSETDTEVIGHLIDIEWSEEDFFEAVLRAARQLEGRFAFAVISNESNEIIAVRRGSPLVFGEGPDGHYIASDAAAFPKSVFRVWHLDESEVVRFNGREGPLFFNFVSGYSVDKRPEGRLTEEVSTELGAWPHLMIKEIMEERKLFARGISLDQRASARAADLMTSADRVVLTACGTAYYVSLLGQYYLSDSRIPAECVLASEFMRCAPSLGKQSVLICVSQSGETADVLEAINEARKRGAKIISIVNARNSSIERVSDMVFHVGAGPERAVASTKAAAAQIITLAGLAFACALGKRLETFNSALLSVDRLLEEKFRPLVDRIASEMLEDAISKGLFIIGRGKLFPIALEGALKVQEVAYVHAFGFAGGELKHGPIALLTNGTPVIVLMGENAEKRDTSSNAAELRARGAVIIGISPTRDPSFDHWLPIPDAKEAGPLAALVPLQMLAYRLAVLRGFDPDMPRNLAKSVTVK